MKNILFYLHLYLTPSMTFIYRQLIGVSENFNTIVLCSRKLANRKTFYFNNLYYFPPTLLQKIFLRLRDRIKFGHGHLSVHVDPVLFKNQKKKIKKLIIDKKISIIHANFGPSGIEILPVAKELKIPLIVSFHGYDASRIISNQLYVNRLKQLFEYGFIITPSEFMLKRLIQYGAKKDSSMVIHYGIPLEVFNFVKRELISNKKSRGEQITFLQVSNFVEKKGHEYTIAAFRKLIDYYSNAKLILAGEGYLRKKAIRQASDLNILENIEFPGLVNQHEVRNLMAKADVFLHHSITAADGDEEGIPNVIMEAMATGLPVISTYHAGIPELIVDGVNGYLVQEKNIIAYSNKMVKILIDNGEIGNQARITIEREFNLQLQNKKISELYSEIIK